MQRRRKAPKAASREKPRRFRKRNGLAVVVLPSDSPVITTEKVRELQEQEYPDIICIPPQKNL